ncbi:MAG TPA: DinB family protein, partial [Microlunatus sp.]
DLHSYLRGQREAVLWKVDGLSEYDVRRPLTQTGTNLLGLVKHLTGVELLYFGYAYGRMIDDPPAWFGEHAEPNSDFWATADESRDRILADYRRACAFADETITGTDLAAIGHVEWWPEGQPLHRFLVHVLAEVSRHLGHVDIVRELIDQRVGMDPELDLMDLSDGAGGPRDDAWWDAYRTRIEEAARSAAGASIA